MSYRYDYKSRETKVYKEISNYVSYSDLSEEDLTTLFHRILNEGMHGICFSLYEEGQSPGDIIEEAQVRRRMEIIQPYTSWVRSFSCIEGNEWIPKVAKEMGIRTLVGAWLGPDDDKNEEEIEALINLGQRGLIDIAAVGNEVLYRNDLPKEKLLAHLKRVKEALPNIPVGYVDAYYEFTRHPDLCDACDVILTNCYPFWEGTPHEHALAHMNSMYHQALEAGKGKQVIITETGWPSQGENFEASHPSKTNAMKYFIQTQQWAKDMNIASFYFSSFDEAWKIGDEGDVGAYWGIWDKNEQFKWS